MVSLNKVLNNSSRGSLSERISYSLGRDFGIYFCAVFRRL